MPPPPAPGGGYAAPVMAPPTDSQATVSLVLGIISVICCALVGPVAFFLGNSARGRIQASGGTVGGSGMATAGMILGIIGSVFLLLGILYGLLLAFGIAGAFRPNG